MNADKKPRYESESREIVGSAMEVLNELGQMMNDLSSSVVRNFVMNLDHIPEV
jgi:hypothetical protein